MTNTRATLESHLLTADPELIGAMRATIDGFEAVLDAVATVRKAKEAYTNAKKAGYAYDAGKLKPQWDKAEKELDNLVKHWQERMKPASKQISLF